MLDIEYDIAETYKHSNKVYHSYQEDNENITKKYRKFLKDNILQIKRKKLKIKELNSIDI